jgi:hypothetical protein
MIKKLIIVSLIVVLSAFVFILFLQTNAGWVSRSEQAVDLTLQECRPYLPARLALKQSNSIPTGTDMLATQQLGNIWQKVSNGDDTALTSLGECYRNAELDAKSREEARLRLENEVNAIFPRIQSAKNYYGGLPAPTSPGYRRNIFD